MPRASARFAAIGRSRAISSIRRFTTSGTGCIDYTKLRHLLVVNRQASRAELNGNFDLLRHVTAEEQADCRIRPSSPLDRLAERENFLSLMHFFGLLSIRGIAEGTLRLGIPNQTVKQLMYGYLRDAYRDAEAFAVDLYALEHMMYAMACRGAWRPVLEFLADAIARQTGRPASATTSPGRRCCTASWPPAWASRNASCSVRSGS